MIDGGRIRSDGTNLELWAGQAERMTIESNGNIGIGTNNPLAPLHVMTSTSTSPANNGVYIYNTTNSANQHAIMSVRVAGTSAGDPFVS